MLKLLSLKRKIATVQFETPEKDIPELFDFNPVLQQYSLIREASFETIDTEVTLLSKLDRYKDASIINTLSHIPTESKYRRVMYNGLPFIDNFGFYVYLKSTVVWGKRGDVDLRFNSNMYPYALLEPDLMFLFK